MDKLPSLLVLVVLLCGACVAGVDPSPTGTPTMNPAPVQTQSPSSSPGPAPQRTPRFTPFPTLASDELFDGSFYGWRFGPDEGQDRNISGDCEGGEYGSDHPTDLDFKAEYLPDGHQRLSVVKWACGTVGFSVAEEYSFDSYPGSYVFLQRGLVGVKAAPLRAPVDFVRACEVRGRPAVCVHYIDDDTGRGGHPAEIIVIDDGSLDPYAVLFRVMGSELPFAELMKMMESVVGD